MTFKIICLILMTIAAFGVVITPMFFTEKKYPDAKKRIRLMTRVRVGCFLTMLILLLICIII